MNGPIVILYVNLITKILLLQFQNQLRIIRQFLPNMTLLAEIISFSDICGLFYN